MRCWESDLRILRFGAWRWSVDREFAVPVILFCRMRLFAVGCLARLPAPVCVIATPCVAAKEPWEGVHE
jgi:hypothetical protein